MHHMTGTSGPRPFLLISTRDDPVAAQDEVRGFLHLSGLPAVSLVVLSLAVTALPADLRLDDYAGIMLGGSPYNSSDEPEAKSAAQLRIEAELARLLDDVVERDYPFLGACYGIGTLGLHQGARVDRTYGEAVGTTRVVLTSAGAADPITAGMPRDFDAFVGHKEAVSALPDHAVLLATSAPCPVQMFRIGQNLYATQFHPELDPTGLATRIEIYRDAGYFPPDQAAELSRAARASEVPWAGHILRNFVRMYGRL